MEVKMIEATQSLGRGPNWGKFAVCRWTADEWRRSSALWDESRWPLLRECAWEASDVFVMDLQTKEGARFRPGERARYALNETRIWVCVLFEDFLEWLLAQDLTDLGALPDVVELPESPFDLYGYRRSGPSYGKVLGKIQEAGLVRA